MVYAIHTIAIFNYRKHGTTTWYGPDGTQDGINGPRDGISSGFTLC